MTYATAVIGLGFGGNSVGLSECAPLNASNFFRGVQTQFYRAGSDPDALASDAVDVHDGEPGSDPTQAKSGSDPCAPARDFGSSASNFYRGFQSGRRLV